MKPHEFLTNADDYNASKGLSVANERIYQLAEYIEWMASSPWYAVKQYLLNCGYTINEINQAAQLYVVSR